MTLAPRSWPSRPGFATTTRYGRCTARNTRQVPSKQQKRAPKRRRTTYAAATAVTGVIVAFGLFALIARVAAKPSSNAKVGGRTRAVYDVGGSRLLAKQIAENGPLLFQALVGDVDIFVQHQGADAGTGWQAFDARAAGQPRRCSVQWKSDRQLFVDPCSQQTYPPDGSGLTHHPVNAL